MTKKSETKTTTTKSNWSAFNRTMDLLAFITVCVGGIALLLAHFVQSIASPMSKIADVVGWTVLSLLSIKFVSHRRKIWIWVVWAVAIVMVVTGIILK